MILCSLFRTKTTTLIFFSCWCSLFAQAEEVIRITNGEWPPFMSQDYLNYGAGSHIVSAAFALENIKVIYGFYPWKRAMKEASEGKWDATLLWGKNEERQQYFLYSDPVLTLRTVFFHRKDMPFNWKNWDDLKGYKVGVTRGYYYGEGLKKSIEKNIFEVDIGNTDVINLHKLLAKRIQLFVIEPEVGYELLAEHFTDASTELLTNHPRPLRETQWHLLISKKSPKAQYWLEKFNKGLKVLTLNGKLDQIMEDVLLGKYRPDNK
ncbi:transporter substrate-binding domain-containing protein [Endozoicomonas sp. SM1973]|uniref:Transporter substrate-binding domain-containing protein n=1 Tax=Spartinivicinus marinus TaxID=2994442 RepID=A0A853IFT6_9GAMM|nr:transporter substrate-binding domain-containing protein [Spartinivicinus marinus]MCX4025889.1 transporter substrate-binding domain-containing protein [Spartinivicinus marinus]NYZ68841.1 transporter substrate-binding domain-containing protein [Spartinivicinus marinus]